MKKLISIILAAALVLAQGITFAQNPSESEVIYANRDSVILSSDISVLPGDEFLVAEFDGNAITQTYSAQYEQLTDGTFNIKTENGFDFDKEYIIMLGNESLAAFTLESLISDDFEDGITGWKSSAANSSLKGEYGCLFLPGGNEAIYYDTEELPYSSQYGWSDYTVDIEIENEKTTDYNANAEGSKQLNLFSLYTHTGLSSVMTGPRGAGEGFNFGLYGYQWHTNWHTGVCFEMKPSEMFTTDNVSAADSSADGAEFSVGNGGYGKLAFVGSKTDMNGNFTNVRYVLGKNSQYVYINNELSMKAAYEEDCTGAFMISADSNNASQPVYIDEILIYRFRNIEIPIPQVSDVIIEETDGGFEVSYSYDGTNDEGTSEIKWYYKETLDGEYLLIDGQCDKFLPYNEAYMILKVEVVPYDNQGVAGFVKSFEFAPAIAPEIDGEVTISGDKISGGTLTALYRYYDINGDAEGESRIEWILSDDGVNEECVIATGKTFIITEECLGKYIAARVTPVSVAEPFEGESWQSSYIYIEDKIKIENIYTSAGKIYIKAAEDIESAYAEINGTEYEAEVSENLVVISTAGLDYDGTNVITLRTDDKAVCINADFEMLLYDDFDDDIDGWQGEVSYNSGRGALTLESVSSDSKIVYYADDIITEEIQKTWTDYTVEFDLLTTSSVRMFVTTHTDFNGSGNGYITLVRKGTAGWFSGVFLASTRWTGGGSVDLTVPEDGEFVKFAGEELEFPCNMTVINDADTQRTFLGGKQTSYQEFTEHPSGGVSFTTAYGGAVTIDNLKIYRLDWKTAEFIPDAENLRIDGNLAVGETLNAVFDYVHEGDISKDNVLYSWLCSDTEDGEYQVIEGENEVSFTVTEEYTDKYLKVSDIPYDTSGMHGIKRTSDYIIRPYAPEASELGYSAEPVVGRSIDAKYKYFDKNYDAPGESLIVWQYADIKNASDSEFKQFASGKNVIVPEELAGKYIRFAVTPKSTAAPYDGETKYSEVKYLYHRPEIANLKIQKSSAQRLSVSYDVVSKDSIQPGESKIEWYMGSSLIGTDSYIDLSNQKASIRVVVTPVLSFEGITGESKEASYAYAGVGSGSPVYGGGSSGGGGGGSVSSVKNPAISVQQKPEETKIVFNDVENHWSKDFAYRSVELGIMEAASENAFNPEVNVTRAEMTAYILKALKIEPAKTYNGRFYDVKADDIYAGYIQRALDLKMISEDDYFNPNRFVSREEFCSILVRKLNEETKEEHLSSGFADEADISDWAKLHVGYAVYHGIVKGEGNNIFNPKGTVTRAQAATMLVRVCE